MAVGLLSAAPAYVPFGQIDVMSVGRGVPRQKRKIDAQLWRHALALSALMAASTALSQTFGLVAPFLLDDLKLTVATVGLLPSLTYLSAMATASVVGSWCDRGSGAPVAGVVLTVVASTTLGVAIAPTIWVVGVAALLNGVAMTAGNPLTNRLVREWGGREHWGFLVGLKQSGVPLGGFVLAATVPAVAERTSWRIGIALTLVLPLAAAALLWGVSRSHPAPPASVQSDVLPSWHRAAPSGQRRGPLAMYLAIVGCVSGVLGAYLVTYLVEDIRIGAARAGLIAATLSIAGLASRVVLARFVHHSDQGLRLLAGLAWVGALGLVLLIAASRLQAFAWVGAVVVGAAILGSQAVSMLLVVFTGPRVGAVSGVMMRAFYGGFLVGPPLAGALLKGTGSFAIVWWVMALVCVSNAVVALSMATGGRVAGQLRRSSM